MPDVDEMKEGKKYYIDTPQKTDGFFLKGSNSLDWGMKNRLARIFNPGTGRTVMLAVDHGYFQGPTKGLERIDINILPLVPHADTLMLTRGILRSIVPPSTTNSIVLRVSGGTSILKELSNEDIAVDIEESIRLNVCAMAVQVFIGGEYERQSIINMTKMVDIGIRYGIPTLAVTAVGKEMDRAAEIDRRQGLAAQEGPPNGGSRKVQAFLYIQAEQQVEQVAASVAGRAAGRRQGR